MSGSRPQSPGGAEPIRVLCVDDHALVREGIGLIIGRQSDIEVVGEAATVKESIERYARLRPDVMLLDLELGASSGVEVIKAVRATDPTARIIVLTVHQGDEDIRRAMAAGAVTYLFKDALSDDLIRVIREVHAGHRPVHPDVEATLLARGAKKSLTGREIEVLELVARGLRNHQIASNLRITEETVQVHVRNILDKLEVADRTAAATVALRRGIIHLS